MSNPNDLATEKALSRYMAEAIHLRQCRAEAEAEVARLTAKVVDLEAEVKRLREGK